MFKGDNLSITKYFGFRCCLALTRGRGAQAGGHTDGLVDDVLGPAGALGAVGQGLQAHPQLVADCPAVRVSPGLVSEDKVLLKGVLSTILA